MHLRNKKNVYTYILYLYGNKTPFVVQVPRTRTQAERLVRGLASTVYGRLFANLVAQMNAAAENIVL